LSPAQLRRGVVLLVLLSLGWGLNWPAMKILLAEMPVWTFRAICMVIGSAGLMTFAALKRQRVRLLPGEALPVLITSLFNMVAWNILSGYGISLIEAGRAAIIGYTMPLWAAVLGPLLLQEKLTRDRLIGLGLGMAGLLVLLAEDFGALGRSPIGTLAMLGAAFSWALGMVLTKRYRLAMPVLSFSAWQLTFAAPFIIAGAFVFDGPPDLQALSTDAWLALAYAIGVAVLFCTWLWFSILSLLPAVLASIGTLGIPVVGLVSSALLLHEPLGWRQVLAMALVASGLAVVLVLPVLRRPALP
jgi:drug/metabolite transporter (DMT)-like permease